MQWVCAYIHLGKDPSARGVGAPNSIWSVFSVYLKRVKRHLCLGDLAASHPDRITDLAQTLLASAQSK